MISTQEIKNRVKKFHHVSTDEVFGSLELNDTSKFSERTNYLPRSPYSASKAAADHLVRACHVTYKLPITTPVGKGTSATRFASFACFAAACKGRSTDHEN